MLIHIMSLKIVKKKKGLKDCERYKHINQKA